MFDGLSPWTLVAFFLLLIVWLAMMGALAFFVVRVILRNSGGGWSVLSARYAASESPPPGSRLATGRTVQFGNVVARRCTTVATGPRGLFVQVPWRPAALIPWSEIRSATPTTLHWRQAVSLEVGEPAAARLTFYREDFEPMQPYVRQAFAQHEKLIPMTTTRCNDTQSGVRSPRTQTINKGC